DVYKRQSRGPFVSRVSVMTVKTSDTCSSRRRSQLVCKRMPGADKPVRARQRVLAGVGAGLTMRHQSRLY
ncbi:hypothetical protein ET132_14340, partial [Klebsiella pneumoniae]